MPLNYNFAFKNSNLKRWKRPAPKNILTSDVDIKKKITYLYQIFYRNPELFYPPILILIATIAVQISTIYPTKTINRLENTHKEYEGLTQKLSTLQSRMDMMKKHLNNMSVFFSKPTPVYLFAFYLQNSIPQGVQLSNYSISENGFSISASSFEIEPLNEMVTLLIESPIINKQSVKIKTITRENTTGNSNMRVEINGDVLKLSMLKREKLYNESNSYGLLRKLIRFNNMNLLIRS